MARSSWPSDRCISFSTRLKTIVGHAPIRGVSDRILSVLALNVRFRFLGLFHELSSPPGTIRETKKAIPTTMMKIDIMIRSGDGFVLF